MMQEDSNGETTFEIIDKKIEELPGTVEKTESLSSISSSISLLPSPGVSMTNVSSSTTGNLLSNVSPPSALPSFISVSPLSTPPLTNATSDQITQPPKVTQTNRPTNPSAAVGMQPVTESFYPRQFSAAIPPSKGIQHGSTSEKVQLENVESSGFIGWMKGAIASGGILSKVTEKAKNSVDCMIATLDPQMREFIYSGGDLNLLVASNQELIISPIRQAFQNVFGRATVMGIPIEVTNIAAQPVGFNGGIKAAEEKLHAVSKNPNVQPVPIVAVENFILEVGENKWYDLGVLLLYDPLRQVTLQTFTQMTPIPTAIVSLAQEGTSLDYPFKSLGYSVPIGILMAKNLETSYSEWHYALAGVSRGEMILLAATTLASMYKRVVT